MRSHPGFFVLVGALAISATGVLVRLVNEPPAAVGVYRCLYALPVLGVLAYLETRRAGGMGHRRHLLSALAGVFFALDLEFWHHGIAAFGAGLSTVVSNLQVVIVGGVAWLLFGERPSRRTGVAVPIALIGVLLISGVLEAGAYGDNPALGVLFSLLTAIAYAGFLLVIRRVNADLRGAAGPLFWSTAWCGATMAVFGLALDELSWPSLEPQLWLVTLALSAQVIGYLAIAHGLPRMPAIVSSMILLAQPCLSVGLAALIVDERPSALQLGGVATVIFGIAVATARLPLRSRRLTPAS